MTNMRKDNLDIRKHLREKRRNLTESERNSAAYKLVQRFIQSIDLTRYQNIAFYFAFDGEIDPIFILEACWKKNKKCFLPIISHQHLYFTPYHKDIPLKENRYHIPEPVMMESQPQKFFAKEMDLILLPLVAFDKYGHRLGMGKGFYDTTLKNLENSPEKPFLLGLGYSFQCIDKITPHAGDMKLDGVLTDEGICIFSS